VSEFPRMLYRPGTMLRNWHGHNVDWQIVEDAAEQAEALAQGWNLSPDALDHDGDGQKGGAIRRRGRPRKVRDNDDAANPVRSD